MFVLYDGNTTVDGKTSYSTQGGYENVLLYLRLKGLFLTPLSGAGFFPHKKYVENFLPNKKPKRFWKKPPPFCCGWQERFRRTKTSNACQRESFSLRIIAKWWTRQRWGSKEVRGLKFLRWGWRCGSQDFFTRGIDFWEWMLFGNRLLGINFCLVISSNGVIFKYSILNRKM